MGAAIVFDAKYLLLSYNSRGELFMVRLYKTLKWAQKRKAESDAHPFGEFCKVIEVAALRNMTGDGISALNDDDAAYLRSMGIAV